VSGSYDHKGNLFVLKRTDTNGYGEHEIATEMVGTALSTADTLAILPNGPTPPEHPTASGVGISGPWTFECQFRMTGEDDYVSFYLSDDRDVDSDAPEVLWCSITSVSNMRIRRIFAGWTRPLGQIPPRRLMYYQNAVGIM
jgi:hypothetical protein